MCPVSGQITRNADADSLSQALSAARAVTAASHHKACAIDEMSAAPPQSDAPLRQSLRLALVKLPLKEVSMQSLSASLAFQTLLNLKFAGQSIPVDGRLSRDYSI